MRYHFTTIWLLIIKKLDNSKSYHKCDSGRTLMHNWKECELIQDLAFSCKVEQLYTLWHSNFILGIYPRETPTQGDEYEIVHSRIFPKDKKMEITPIIIDRIILKYLDIQTLRYYRKNFVNE